MTRSTRSGFGRVLVFVYGLFAVAALLAPWSSWPPGSQAPVAYSLSLFSGIVYIIATWALATDRRRVALVTIAVELTGVLVIGTLSHPADIDRASVWSDYGNGYGLRASRPAFVGLWWLWRVGPRAPTGKTRSKPPRPRAVRRFLPRFPRPG